MSRRFLFLIFFLLLVASAFAQKEPSSRKVTAPAVSSEKEQIAAVRLPVKRVVLYKIGVGFFEHFAR